MFKQNRYQEQIIRMTKQDKEHSFEDSTIPDGLEKLSYKKALFFLILFLFQV